MSDRPDGFVRLASRDLWRHDRAAMMQTSRHAPNGSTLVKLLVKPELLKFLRFKADVLHAGQGEDFTVSKWMWSRSVVPSNAPFQAVGLYMPTWPRDRLKGNQRASVCWVSNCLPTSLHRQKKTACHQCCCWWEWYVDPKLQGSQPILTNFNKFQMPNDGSVWWMNHDEPTTYSNIIQSSPLAVYLHLTAATVCSNLPLLLRFRFGGQPFLPKHILPGFLTKFQWFRHAASIGIAAYPFPFLSHPFFPTGHGCLCTRHALAITGPGREVGCHRGRLTRLKLHLLDCIKI